MIKGLDKAVPDLCSPDQSQDLSCPTAQVAFNSAMIWYVEDFGFTRRMTEIFVNRGVVGPRRLFGVGAPYRGLLLALLGGAVAPLPAYFLAKRWKNAFIQKINFPVIFAAMLLIPPASGINYSSWFMAGVVFRRNNLSSFCIVLMLIKNTEFLLRRRKFRWWSKFNFISSAALDSGTVVGVTFVFLLLQLPKGGTLSINWWGNTVFLNTDDAAGVPYRIASVFFISVKVCQQLIMSLCLQSGSWIRALCMVIVAQRY